MQLSDPATLKPSHVEFSTPDGFTLPGLWFSPPSKLDTKTACIFLHGCGSSSVFYKVQKMQTFAQQLASAGIHFFAFNNRGAHYIKKLHQKTEQNEQDVKIGTALELIEDCIPDIEGAIAFAHKQGMETIFLVGESTGANKIMVYDQARPDNTIAGYALVGAGDDMGLWAKQFGYDTWHQTLTTCKEKIAIGHGHHLHTPDITAGIMSYQSLYDVLNPNGAYNCFPYTEYFREEKWSTKPLFDAWSKVTTPTLVLYGEEDIFTYVTPHEAVTALQTHQNKKAAVQYEVVKNADHSFHGKESEEISRIIKWWQTRT